MNKLFGALLLLALAFTPSYSQDLVLEEAGEYLVIVNWEDFLDPGNDNPIVEVEIPPPEVVEVEIEEEGDDSGNVIVEVSLGEEGDVSETTEVGESTGESAEVVEVVEIETEAEEIEVVVIEYDRILFNNGFLA